MGASYSYEKVEEQDVAVAVLEESYVNTDGESLRDPWKTALFWVTLLDSLFFGVFTILYFIELIFGVDFLEPFASAIAWTAGGGLVLLELIFMAVYWVRAKKLAPSSKRELLIHAFGFLVLYAVGLVLLWRYYGVYGEGIPVFPDQSWYEYNLIVLILALYLILILYATFRIIHAFMNQMKTEWSLNASELASVKRVLGVSGE